MCARLLKERGHGMRKTWVERVIGGIEKRVLGLYGGSLGGSCVIAGSRRDLGRLFGGHDLLVHARAEELPAPGGQWRHLRRVYRSGRLSPKQMREYQDRVDQMLQQDQNVITDFTLTGATGFLLVKHGHHLYLYWRT